MPGTLAQPAAAPHTPHPAACRRAPFAERRANYRTLLVSHLADLARSHRLRILGDMHGNVGDHLIWDGTAALVAACGATARPLPLAAVSETIARDDCLVIPGSGAFTRLWHEWLPALVADAADRFARVVIMPSQFDPSVPVVAAALARPNVFAFAREPVSYGRIKRFGRAVLAFDPALYARRLAGEVPPATGAGRRLVALREDAGSMLPDHGVRPAPAVNRDVSRHARNLDEFLGEIRDVDEIVTDRLHVAVAAVLSGRRLRYVDPCGRKISDYFAFVFGDEIGDRARPCTIEWLLAHGLANREA